MSAPDVMTMSQTYSPYTPQIYNAQQYLHQVRIKMLSQKLGKVTYIFLNFQSKKSVSGDNFMLQQHCCYQKTLIEGLNREIRFL